MSLTILFIVTGPVGPRDMINVVEPATCDATPSQGIDGYHFWFPLGPPDSS